MRFRSIVGATVLLVAVGIIRIDLHAQSVPQNPCATSSAKCVSYEVVIEFVGYTGLADSADCKVNPRGYDRLTGTLSAVETPERDEDVVYTGTLKRETAIDVCEAKGRRGPQDDERVWCVMTLTGSALTNVELTVYGESDRGAYMKASPARGPSSATVSAGCDPQETNQVRADYPSSSDGGGASPNGQQIDDERATDPNGRRVTFFVGGLARLREGNYPTTSPKDGWSMRVIRRIP